MSVADFIAALVLCAFAGAALAFCVDQHFVWRKKTVAETKMYDSIRESLGRME